MVVVVTTTNRIREKEAREMLTMIGRGMMTEVSLQEGAGMRMKTSHHAEGEIVTETMMTTRRHASAAKTYLESSTALILWQL